MVEHDFRYSLMNPQHTLIECRTLAPGRYQVTGNGGSIRNADVLLVTLKGSKDLSMRLTVENVRHLLKPMGQWVAMASGPVHAFVRQATGAAYANTGDWTSRK